MRFLTFKARIVNVKFSPRKGVNRGRIPRGVKIKAMGLVVRVRQKVL